MVEAVDVGGAHIGTGLAIGGGRNRLDELPAVRVSEVEAVEALGHHDGPAAVGREVKVVGIGDGDGRSGPGRPGIYRRQGVALRVVDIERAQIPRGGDVLGRPTYGEVVHDLVGGGVDHVHAVAEAVGDVDAQRHPLHRRVQVWSDRG